jgi:hypothetical protein
VAVKKEGSRREKKEGGSCIDVARNVILGRKMCVPVDGG